MVKSHSCTEGFLMFASNAPTAGACVLGCGPGDSCAEGVVVGTGTVTGNPVEIRTVGSATTRAGGTLQPVVAVALRSEEHTSELQSLAYLVCRLLLEKKKQ